MSILNTAWETIAPHPALAYGAVFVLALSESMPVVGAVVPGTAAILAIAALVPSGAIGLWPILVAATAGAVLSDGASYWLGHVYHRGLLDRWPLNRCPALVARSERFFARHGAMSVALARFVPGVRAFVPLIAGIVRMPVARFYAANVASAVVWAMIHVIPGAALGGYLLSTHMSAERLVVPGFAVAGLLWAVVAIGRRASRQGASSP